MISFAILIEAVKVCDTHFPIRNVIDGKIFNQRKLKTKTKVHIDVLDEILYEGKWRRIPAHRHKCMVQQIHMDYLPMNLQSTKKTNVVLQSAPESCTIIR